MPQSAGACLGRYEILSAGGAGGMGEVWQARDTRLDRIVAIKTINKSRSSRFEQKARAIPRLR
jgi:serine/threonine protein kinase